MFAAVALWELMAPRRAPSLSRLLRWSSNLGLVVLNSVVLRMLFPVAAVGIALAAEANGWGLLNVFHLPLPVAMILSVVVMDFAIYLQHILMHAVPALWRLHRMHHTDLNLDVTTGFRNHPIEIVISMAGKLMVIGALGPPAIAIIIFEVILNAASMFNHGNVRLPKTIDRMLRLMLVTPDMHRVHHSVIPAETNSNFGFFLPWWDRLFGTYTDQPRDGHKGMTIGIEQFRESRDMRLDRLLLQPFRDATDKYSINRTGTGDGAP